MNPPRRRLSRSAPAACVLALAAVALAGCGGGSSTSSATTHAATTGGSTPGPESLVSHLPPTTAFPQVHPTGLPQVISSPMQWAARGGLPGTPGQRAGARLTKLGFVAGLRELLGSEQRSVSEVDASVEQFRTAAGARSELAYRLAQARATGHSPGYSFARVAANGIPGAFGYAIRQPGTSSDAIIFAAGAYFYLMQSVVPAGSPDPVTLRQLETGAAAWYRRVT